MTYLRDEANIKRMGLDGELIREWMEKELFAKYDVYVAAYIEWFNPARRTQAHMVALFAAEKKFKVVYRSFYNGQLRRNMLVSNIDRVCMGLPEYNSGRTAAPAPTTLIQSTVEVVGPARIRIHFKDANIRGSAKPKGVHGAEIAWAILDEEPVGWAQLVNSSFETHTPFEITFEYNQRGKTFYYALRWENTRGVKGHWNTIQFTIIP
jgi:hypothetical protein